ncbi:hypothetical protein [Azotobacter vinelandii]|uniref:hypothetical protein n=1 Tax=Azotobacter vinelandii TaxID=354 RepID=UPI0020C89475|nr:hypothetical protein [Azotobacter vinelandii]
MMGAAAAPIAIGGGVLSAYSQLQQGRAGIKAANRQQAYYNDQAGQVVAQGDYEADMASEQGRQVAASQRTGFAANGIEVGAGTAGRVEQSTLDMAAQDADQIRRNAFNQAFGLVEQGNETVRQAKANFRSSRFNAMGSLLTGGAQAYSALKR